MLHCLILITFGLLSNYIEIKNQCLQPSTYRGLERKVAADQSPSGFSREQKRPVVVPFVQYDRSFVTLGSFD